MRTATAVSYTHLVYKFNASEGYHHVGLYIGEGGVIEAKGTAYGLSLIHI